MHNVLPKKYCFYSVKHVLNFPLHPLWACVFWTNVKEADLFLVTTLPFNSVLSMDKIWSVVSLGIHSNSREDFYRITETRTEKDQRSFR